MEQTHLRGWRVIMHSIAAQVNGQYAVPEQVQMTAQVSALTIGQVLDESEPTTGHRRQVFIDGEKCSIPPFFGSNFARTMKVQVRGSLKFLRTALL